MRDFARRVGHELHLNRFEPDQQGVWRGVVRAQGLTVELGWVGRRHLKGAAVEHDVARDGLDAKALHAAQQQPQALQHQFGVALPLNDEVAL